MNAYSLDMKPIEAEISILLNEIEAVLARADALNLSMVAIHLNEAVECLRSDQLAFVEGD